LPHTILLDLAMIVVLGVTAQWLAWRLGLPSILLLLTFGICAGPILGWLRPTEIFGDALLLPLVSLAVGLILYEGGLSLKLSELASVGSVVGSLVSIGAIITLLISTVAAHYVLGMDWELATLLGAVLIVTGPTVIAPLLRTIRPTGSLGPVLKWEGIVIDPIGAMLAVLIYEAALIGEGQSATMHIAFGVLKTGVLGGGIGFIAAWILILLVQRYWIADYLQNAASLMLVVAAFTASNLMQHEAGLLAATVMGFVLANQKRVDIERIVEFKENLQVLLISTLFIILGARLSAADLTAMSTSGLAFVAILIFVARPLSAFASTARSNLSIKQRLFIAWMAPRGIVAAAVASVFTIRLERIGYAEAHALVPATFITIIATVAISGLTAPFVARRLGVAEKNPQGILFVGAHGWVRSIASLLTKQGYRVLMVDTNWNNVNAARMAGLPTYAGSILAEHALDDIDLGGIGRLFAVTGNDWVNVLTVRRFERIFGRANCYQVAPEADKKKRHQYLQGRVLFGEPFTNSELIRRHAAGHVPKATRLTESFDYTAYRDRYGDGAVSMFVQDEDRRLKVLTASEKSTPKAGQSVISLVRELETKAADKARAKTEKAAEKRAAGEQKQPASDAASD